MSRWETTSTLEAGVSPASIWQKAYADASAWSKWNAEIKRAQLDGRLAQGAKAKIVFGTGLRLRFHVVAFEEGRLFTDESRLPGARMGHRHLVEPTESGSRSPTRSTSRDHWRPSGAGSWVRPRPEPCPAPSAPWSSSRRPRTPAEHHYLDGSRGGCTVARRPTKGTP